jgi:hypothetical protein
VGATAPVFPMWNAFVMYSRVSFCLFSVPNQIGRTARDMAVWRIRAAEVVALLDAHAVSGRVGVRWGDSGNSLMKFFETDGIVDCCCYSRLFALSPHIMKCGGMVPLSPAFPHFHDMQQLGGSLRVAGIIRPRLHRVGRAHSRCC